MRRFLLFLSVVLLLLLPPVLRTSQETVFSSETAQVSRALGVNASAGTVVSASDSHGGFHGDGLTFIELSFPDGSFGSSIQGRWHALPLSSNLNTLVYGSSGVGPYITRDGAACFPHVQNGYYFFEDRHTESTDPQSDFALFQRYSFNLTLALYDTDAQALYYCKFDT